MKAQPADQRTLLDVADIDRRIAQARARIANPQQKSRLTQLSELKASQMHELTARSGARDDIKTEISRIESDVTVARQRQDRDRDRLTTTTDSKAAVALEAEIASLAKRLGDLEDLQLAAMERLEEADAAVAEQRTHVDATNAEGSELQTSLRAELESAKTEIAGLERDRAAVADKVPAGLLAQYDRLAARGSGAGLLQRGMCGACNIVLPSSDIADVRAAAADDVVFCPECGAILVRTDESGL